MALKAKLKFRGDIPWALESKLISKLGFRIFSRQGREWIIVEKQKPSAFKPEVLVNGELSEEIQDTLRKRCNNIVDMFSDPDKHVFIIKARLRNIRKILPPLQAKFVYDWTERNVGLPDADD